MRLPLHKLSSQAEQGAATVEFAVIVSLLLVVLFGIVEFGLLFWQNHFIENAAREGLRIGVVANNYTCFDGTPTDGCSAVTDRHNVVDTAVRNYLAAMYRPEDVQLLEILSPESGNNEATRKPLTVRIGVRNFFPTLVGALVPGYIHPETITFTVTGDYEDPQEP